MEKLIIEGGHRLFGEVTISGAKNAAVAIIPAALLVDGKCLIENLPAIKDVTVILDMLKELGAVVEKIDDTTVSIDSSNIVTHKAPLEMARKMRASYYLIGALLGRLGEAEVSMPGGCNFGSRPIDQHIKGFEALGAFIEYDEDKVIAKCHQLVGAQIYLDVVSVGATINVMLSAVLAKGTTIIENAAKEPHIVDVANFLNSMGADVKGAGTDIIKITGVQKMRGGSYSIIPDQIEAGTFMVAAAATKGDVVIKNVIPRHLESITAKLIEMGVSVEEYDDSVRVKMTGELNKVNIKTLPYPGFPTDMQPQITSLLTSVKGTSIITESVWESRFQYMDELIKMGASVKVNGQVATITGVDSLIGASVTATDLRAGAGMIIAGLIAKGTTEIYDIKHIDRGYEFIENKFNSLGAKIYRR